MRNHGKTKVYEIAIILWLWNQNLQNQINLTCQQQHWRHSEKLWNLKKKTKVRHDDGVTNNDFAEK